MTTEITKDRHNDWLFHLIGWREKREHFYGAAEHLWEIKRQELWREVYDTWQDFVAEEVDLSRQHVHRLFQMIETKKLPQGRTGKDQLPGMPERHARELQRLVPEARVSALADAVEAAGPNKAPTLQQVKDAVGAKLTHHAKPPQTDSTRPLKEGKFSEVFKASAVFDALALSLKMFRTEITRLIESPAGAVLEKQRQEIERDRVNILNALKFSKPHAACPYCGGSGRDNCDGCEGRGWVTKTVYDSSPAT